jgi:hypothetical protein
MRHDYVFWEGSVYIRSGACASYARQWSADLIKVGLAAFQIAFLCALLIKRIVSLVP